MRTPSLPEFALRNYKRWISPALPASCRYVPTCSEFAAEAMARHGTLRGGLMTLWRLLRCHPFATGGYDPVGLPKSQSAAHAYRAERIQENIIP